MWAVLMAAAFLSGSIPFGLLIGLARGVDIRRVGSGNIGATNVGRVLGRRAFYICFALDVLKGLVPTLAAGWATGLAGRMPPPADQAALWLCVMALTVLGHMFSPWVGFKGGKGVATGLGALAGVFPALTIPAAGALAVWLVFAALWRYVSLASCAAAASLPLWVVAWFLLSARSGAEADRGEWGKALALFLGVTLVLAALVVFKHRGNIRRLRAGTEPRIGARVRPEPGSSS